MNVLIEPFARQIREFIRQNPGHPNPEIGTAMHVALKALERVEERLSVLTNRVELLEDFHVRLMGKMFVGLGSVCVFIVKKNCTWISMSASWADTHPKRGLWLCCMMVAHMILSKAQDYAQWLTIQYVQSVMFFLENAVPMLSNLFHSLLHEARVTRCDSETFMNNTQYDVKMLLNNTQVNAF